MRPARRQAEDVGRDLQRRVRLRTATGNAHFGQARAGLPLDALAAVAQAIGQAYEDGAVDVGPGVDAAEADDRALGVEAGVAQPGRPVRLQHQTRGGGPEGFGVVLDPAGLGRAVGAERHLRLGGERAGGTEQQGEHACGRDFRHAAGARNFSR